MAALVHPMAFIVLHQVVGSYFSNPESGLAKILSVKAKLLVSSAISLYMFNSISFKDLFARCDSMPL